jgi:hypothetical protein
MLRISLFGPPNRRKQPKRYAKLRLNVFVKFLENILTKLRAMNIIILNLFKEGIKCGK